MKIKPFKSIKIVTALGLTTSVLVAFATLGIAIYALFFINSIISTTSANSLFYNEIMIFKDSIFRLVLSFLTLGLVASYYFTKLLVKPIIEVVKGSKELSSGNFDYRLKESNYKEINELVFTYNKMAENLQELYKKLDQKVKDRTKELELANNELKNAQTMMVHSEKMKSLGEMVAGITHEINNPINFVYGNIIHLDKYTNAMSRLIELYEELEKNSDSDLKKQIANYKNEIDIEFIKSDLPKLIKSCLEGTDRTKNIITDLRNFSRFGEMTIGKINLEKEINTTLNILNHKLKGKINVIKEFNENIPEIEGYGGQLNQVFLNILDNASFATKEKGNIFIRIQTKEENVIIEFEDTGKGMSEDELKQIFDPFYTTKPQGEGIGLGLAISYKVIQQHNGKIEVASKIGEGTKFSITLPICLKQIGAKNG